MQPVGLKTYSKAYGLIRLSADAAQGVVRILKAAFSHAVWVADYSVGLAVDGMFADRGTAHTLEEDIVRAGHVACDFPSSPFKTPTRREGAVLAPRCIIWQLSLIKIDKGSCCRQA